MKIATTSNGKLRLRNGVVALVTAAAIGGESATAISLIEPLDMSVLQRLNGQREIPLAGTLTGNAGITIEARAADFNSGAAITAWTAIGTSAADGSYSGKLMTPAGGWYKLQVRAAGSQTVVATGVNKVGVGAVIGFTGQSNCVNMAKMYQNYPTGSPIATCIQNAARKRIGAIVDTVAPNTPSTLSKVTQAANKSGDSYTYMANLVSAQFNIPVCIVDYALGGMGIEYWTQGSKNGWVNFCTVLDQAGGDMEMMVFVQGESSAHAYTSYASIATEWDKLMQQALDKTLRTTSNFKIVMTSLGPGNYSGSTEGEFGRYRAWQRDFATTRTGWIYGGGAHACSTGNTTTADNVHWNNESTYLGRVMPKNYMHRAFGVGVSGEGPRIVSATRAAGSLDVIFTITHAGGTALTDGAGGTGSALTGFRFFDVDNGNALIGFGGTAILNATQFRVTLNALPVGALTADYGITDVPHGAYVSTGTSYVLASTLCDNVVLVNRSVGCLLQPCVAITVTGG